MPCVRNTASIWTHQSSLHGVQSFGCPRKDTGCPAAGIPRECVHHAQVSTRGLPSKPQGQEWASSLWRGLSPQRKHQEESSSMTRNHPLPNTSAFSGSSKCCPLIGVGPGNLIPETELWANHWLFPHCFHLGDWMCGFLSQRLQSHH